MDTFAGRIGFFTAAHIDLFEEVAKLRAMRRIWARLLRDRFGAKEERSCWFRTAIQTSALPLTAQEPLNNIVRAGIQTLAAVLGGSQSIHTTSYDEAFALPSEASHRLSLRTQQIIAYETNVVKTVDPLGGSYFVEWLTNRLEADTLALMDDLRARGGFIESFKAGWVETQIEKARFQNSDRLESGAHPVVGLNCFQDEDAEPPSMPLFRMGREMIESRIAYIGSYRQNRDLRALGAALDRLQHDTVDGKNVMLSVIAAVEASATMGEICQAFREAIGYRLAF